MNGSAKIPPERKAANRWQQCQFDTIQNFNIKNYPAKKRKFPMKKGENTLLKCKSGSYF